MKLSGKCKEEFKNYINSDKNIGELETERIFYYLRLGKITPIIGYLQLYFDSVGIEIFIDYNEVIFFRFDIYSNYIKIAKGTNFKTRQEAWNKAVEKADEFRNEQLKQSEQ